jgi:hypothetical protein
VIPDELSWELDGDTEVVRVVEKVNVPPERWGLTATPGQPGTVGETWPISCDDWF